MARVFVTGSTGFIGKRLVYTLLEQGHEVYALARIKGIGLTIDENPRYHLIYGDIQDPETTKLFPKEIDAAYYLIHSMGTIVENLLQKEREVAQNFISGLEKTQCKQIIYLGGIIEDEHLLSLHLQSRLAVEKILFSSCIPCTVLRSSIIIGSASASFEIVRDLVEKLPIMIAPRWVKSLCQPIAIADVLFYLSKVLLHPECLGKVFDIGGPEAFSFKDVLLRYARFRGLRRYIFDVPVLTPRLSSYWLVLITPVRFSICRYLVESMKQNTRRLNKTLDVILPHTCLTYEESLARAFQKIAQNEVVSTWMDDWNIKSINPNVHNFIEVPQEGCVKDSKRVSISIPFEEVQKRVWSIGGSQGWYSMNWAWRLRGLIDQLLGGTGLNRGRRDPHELQAGDSIDFWRVILADKKKHHLILYAEMKLPGEAWLEFILNEKAMTLTQTATFRPRGFFGYVYWYFCLPFHYIIFNNMIKSIAQSCMIDSHTLRLHAQIGLFSYVTADLRAVCLKEENQDLIVAFFCGDELSEELEDSAQTATTELVSCVPQEGLIHTEFVHGDYPKPMALFGELVYLRYEPGCEVYRKKLPKEVFTEVKSSTLRLAGQRALLGRVTANLRRATICEVGNTIFVHFWYDNTISELDYRLARETTAEVKEAFQLSDPRVFDFKIQQLPFPQRIIKSWDCIFSRYEPSLPEDFIPGW